MNKAINTIILFLAISLFALPTSAQQTYKTGLGLRGGYPSGVSVKHFLSKSSAIEGVLSFGWGGIGITGLYQQHNLIPEVPGMTWYYGGGAHFATSGSGALNPWGPESTDQVFMGADGVVGLEYVFEGAPISLGVDILPILNILPRPNIWFNAAIAIRYTFK